MSSSVSDQLIRDIQTIADITESLIASSDADQVLGAEVELLDYFTPHELVTLAFTREFVKTLFSAENGLGGHVLAQNKLFGSFVRYAMRLYATNILGNYVHCEAQGDVDGFFRQFGTGDEFFGLRNKLTREVVWRIAEQADSLMDDDIVVRMFDSMFAYVSDIIYDAHHYYKDSDGLGRFNLSWHTTQTQKIARLKLKSSKREALTNRKQEFSSSKFVRRDR